MILNQNPYFIGRWEYECLNKRKDGLDTLMAYFRKEVGSPAFHSYHEAIFESKEGEFDVYAQFDYAISTMMFRKVTFGSSDYMSLDLTYGDVFVELWKLFPDRCWLDHLRFKDFRSGSLDQLYINPVPPEEYGETKSVPLIKAVLEKAANEGWLILGDSKKGVGQIRILEDSIQEIETEAWGGLKEWMLDEFPSKIVTVDDKDRWNLLFEESPQIVIERFLGLIWNGVAGWSDLLAHFSESPNFEDLQPIVIRAIQVYSKNFEASNYFKKVARVSNIDVEGTFLDELLEILENKTAGKTLEKYFQS